ncbi:MAG: ATM1-type heavy metal exporter [Alphaproteobacteria bacterium MarineAlpha5_Bin11]|nr:metal ABC transporter permease [Pelagibacteraceae bacterium]PPR43824.1 MAG: ATM1-type heavy metal exporter [Alphaproteobacteria bacterium MarineAlpha5_Bin11]PPR51328.1 MAG: ATM1-type heavy metal exporter [Alphaproteobacteria bacterium MarineAlpha5_Bin10]|tara:strand:- start:6837 stop:8612 length:1776 start_codon:yes stop_codon:yes gene_type:complete
MNSFKPLFNLFHYLWPKDNRGFKIRFVLAIFFLVFAKVSNVFVPIFLGKTVDALDGINTASIVLAIPITLIAAYGLARFLHVAFGEIRDALFVRIGQNAIRRAALKVFDHLHSLSLKFHLNRQTGALSRIIDRGIGGIEFTLRFVTFNVFPTLLEILLVCIILVNLFSWYFSFITFFIIVFYVSFTFLITEWRVKIRKQMNEADNARGQKSIDSLINFETVKYFNNENYESARYDQALKNYEHFAVKSAISLTYLNAGQAIIISVGMIGMMILAALQIQSGYMTIGDFIIVNTYLIQLAIPLNFIGFVYWQIKQSLVDMENMFTLLDEKTEVSDKKGAKDLIISQASIKFKNVSFNYDEKRKIIKNISFEILPNHTVAIVGPTGAGKSTISKIFFRFYNPDSGEIFIDDQNINEVTQSSLRQQIAVVPQDTVLFNDTLYYNIAYGNPNATIDDVKLVAKMAQLHTFIEDLPEGYDTIVGERGLKLSGGEKQRVAIARALLKKPKIFFFDEATSSLDTNTEKEIQKNLEELSKDTTTMVIAHRLSTVVNSNTILVLNEGEIAERGNHKKLMELNGLYASMWRQQEKIINKVK